MTFSRDGTILITNPPAERFLHQWHYEQDGETEYRFHQNWLNYFNRPFMTEEEQTGEITIQGRYYVVIVSPLIYKIKRVSAAQ